MSWEAMWSRGLRPGQAFDAAQVEPALMSLIGEGVLPSGPALVPGCGRGYACAALGADGRSVLGLEVAPTAVQEARQYFKEARASPSCSVEHQDFFDPEFHESHGGKFALGYDCTFLCAMNPSMRQAWAQSWSKVLKPGGELVTLLFPLPREGEADPVEVAGSGPPYTISQNLASNLLSPLGFKLISAEPVPLDKVARNRDEIIARWQAPESR